MKIRFRHSLGLGLGLVLAAVVSGGCSEAVDELTNRVDCHDVCQRYADCFNAEYDVDGCVDRCESDADSSEDREARLETCDNCIDDRSCTSATFSCADKCSGIVP